MSRPVLALLAALGACLPSMVLAAPCPEGMADAKPIQMSNMEIAAPILVAQGVWTGLLVKQFYERDLNQAREACERGAFEARGRAYDLRGGDNVAAMPRVATPRSKKDPVGYLTATPDLMTAMTPGFQGTAPTLGYALVTVDDAAHTTWRVYDKIPVDAVLLADFAQALAGRGQPLMRWRGGKIEIVAPSR